MPKKEESPERDSTRTDTEVVKVVKASRDDPEDPQPEKEAGAGEDISAEETADPGKIEEKFELELPESEEYKDHITDSDDPRLLIGKKFHQKHRDFGENSENITDIADSVVENDAPGDIIEDEIDERPGKVRVKVNQEIRYVDQSKIDNMSGETQEDRVQAYQKHLAVVAGMESNAKQRESLNEREHALAAREQQLHEQEAALPTLDTQKAKPLPTDPPTGDQSLDALSGDAIESIYDGDEEAPTKLSKFVNETVRSALAANPAVDVEKLKRDIRADFEKAARMKTVVKATSALIKEHPELDGKHADYDHRLFEAIDGETVVVKRQNPDWEPQEVMKEAYRRISEWRGGHKTDSMNEKQASKRDMIRPRVSSGRYVAPQAPPEKTRSSYVADVRKSRGQDA